MSSDEVSALREDIAVLSAIVEERAKSASNNSTLLKTIGVAVALQIVMSFYIAGQKTQMLDRLQSDVIGLQANQTLNVACGNNGINFSTAITLAVSGAKGLADATAISAGDVLISLKYV